MSDDSEKTEEPTEHKLQEARKKGQVLKSQDVVMVITFIGAAGMLTAMNRFMGREVYNFTRHVWSMIPEFTKADPNKVFSLLMTALLTYGKVLLPFLVVGFILAIIGNVAQVGFLFTMYPLNPSLNKINPIQGFKKIFSKRSIVELLKNILKLFVASYFAYKIFTSSIEALKSFPSWTFGDALLFLKKQGIKLLWQIVVAYIALAAFDYYMQYKFFMKDMRMSLKELKDEYKETEGDPHVKAKQREMGRQLVFSGGGNLNAVADATAVVTNPTHIAVALKYEYGEMPAPKVIAKGERYFAQKIKEIAEENDVPIVENVDLAQALYQACEPGDYVPPSLYKAVAEVLAFVYKLKRKRKLKRLKRRSNSGYRTPPRSLKV